MSNVEVAQEILRQLGGHRMAVMTGAKNMLAIDNGVSFRIGRNDKRVNYVKIELTPMDVYNVEYGYIRGTKYTVRAREEGIYNDMLVSSFERNTGMYTRL
jgi:hypothetical protein